MSATPGATDEYSTGSPGSPGGLEPASGPEWRAARRRPGSLAHGTGGAIFAVVIVAALLLAAAELTTLYQAHLANKTAPIQSVTAGSHNSYAMLPIAALAAAFAFGLWRSGSRLMLLAIGVLGVIALLIALVHDLPDTHAVGLAHNNSISATTTAGIGLYLETLGAVLLIAASGLGFLIDGLPRHRPQTQSRRRDA